MTIPGAVGGFCTLSDDWGVLGLEQVLAPAIQYADAGVPVAPKVAFDWHKHAPTLQAQARSFFLLDGQAPKAGQIFRAPGQAEVLRRIAKQGAKGFYQGEVADDMLHSLQAMGGLHQAEDFATEAPNYTTPICGTYKDVELVEHPPNSQGAVAILMLNMLQHFDLDGLDPFGAKRSHIETEIAKLAYDARNRFLGDPRSASMQKTLNLKVKYRESFRPFAPSILRDDLTQWFEHDADSPYMLMGADVARDKRRAMTDEEQNLFGIEKLNVPRSSIPAVTHVDYSARIQTVHEDTNPRYHALISAFKDKTGCPVVVNTSFNVRGEPIVCTPEDAFRCFMGTELDMLAIGNCILWKADQDPALKLDYKDAFELD